MADWRMWRGGGPMTPAARVAAACEVLDQILDGMPAEKALTGWARRSRFAGSGDRAALRDLVFDALRRKRSLAALGGALTGRGLMIGLVRADGGDIDALFTGQGHAPDHLSDDEQAAGRNPEPGAEASDMPDWLWPDLCRSLGDRTEAIAAVLQARAPIMLRVNKRKSGVEDAQAALAEQGIITQVDPVASTALRVVEGARRVAQSPAYLSGMVELQDGSSQAIIDKLGLVSGSKILDFCAGGGGKSLALAAATGANIYAHDIQPGRMKDLPARAARADVRIDMLDAAQVAAQAPFDLVLCDAPCSGSGAWRRAPEGKWLLTRDRLDELTQIQDGILAQAAGLVTPSGVLAYATCSVLKAENEDRIAAFLAKHADWHQIDMCRWTPGPSGDGFFLSRLQRTA
jgi:16S rRNA (cytosine967-C5)-methyltransferase